MSRTTTIIVGLMVVAVLASAVVFFSFSHWGRSVREIWRVQRKMAYRDYLIEGTVCDEAGKPLDKVMIHIIIGRKIKSGFDTDYESRYEDLRDATFRVEAKDCSNVSVLFFKKGYRQRDLQFNSPGRHTNVRVIMVKEQPATTQSAPGRVIRPHK